MQQIESVKWKLIYMMENWAGGQIVTISCSLIMIYSTEFPSTIYSQSTTTHFSECLAHEDHPNFLKSPGDWPQPQAILILSPKTISQNWHDRESGSVTRVHWENWVKSMCTSFGVYITNVFKGKKLILLRLTRAHSSLPRTTTILET